MRGYEIGKPFYQSNVWIANGKGDPLLLEEFTSKKEAVKCIMDFLKKYKGKEILERYVSHFDENGFSDYSFNV